MATGSEKYAGINAGKTRRTTPATRRTPTRGTGTSTIINGLPLF